MKVGDRVEILGKTRHKPIESTPWEVGDYDTIAIVRGPRSYSLKREPFWTFHPEDLKLIKEDKMKYTQEQIDAVKRTEEVWAIKEVNPTLEKKQIRLMLWPDSSAPFKECYLCEEFATKDYPSYTVTDCNDCLLGACITTSSYVKHKDALECNDLASASKYAGEIKTKCHEWLKEHDKPEPKPEPKVTYVPWEGPDKEYPEGAVILRLRYNVGNKLMVSVVDADGEIRGGGCVANIGSDGMELCQGFVGEPFGIAVGEWQRIKLI